MTDMAITIIWPNGHVTTGSSWRDTENAVRAAQWQPYRNRREFRQDMRWRCFVWTGQRPRVTLPQTSEGFIRSMAETGAIMLVVEKGQQ